MSRRNRKRGRRSKIVKCNLCGRRISWTPDRKATSPKIPVCDECTNYHGQGVGQ